MNPFKQLLIVASTLVSSTLSFAQIPQVAATWTGLYNDEQLPSTDYWFTVDYLENGTTKQFKAHFSLVR